jgi:exosome complex RNA-binding protein Rrp4
MKRGSQKSRNNTVTQIDNLFKYKFIGIVKGRHFAKLQNGRLVQINPETGQRLIEKKEAAE